MSRLVTRAAVVTFGVGAAAALAVGTANAAPADAAPVPAPLPAPAAGAAATATPTWVRSELPPVPLADPTLGVFDVLAPVYDLLNAAG